MVLPTDPALLDPVVATPAQHRRWHEEIHATLSESPDQPTSIPAGSTGHLAAHDAVEPQIGSGLPATYAENDPAHGPEHHYRTHMAITARAYGSSSGPVTITTGGTYSGVYESLDPAIPAVRINTTQPVTLSGARIRHAGQGIQPITNSAQLTVTDTSLLRLDPGIAANGRAINGQQFASLVVENCLLLNGDGIYLLNDVVTPTLVRVRYNRSFDIGRYKHGGSSFVQFLQFDKVQRPGAEVAWNHSVNRYGQSEVEDNINLYQSGGGSGNPIDLHHNLIDGAYDATSNPTGDGYTGGGIICGDGTPGGSWVLIRDNYFVATSNYGGSIYGGSNNTLLRNRAVSDSFTDTGVLHSPTFGNGFMAWDGNSTGTMVGIVVQDNVAGWVRRTGVGTNTERANLWLPEAEDGDPGDSATGNTTLANPIDTTDEQAERDAWEAARQAAGVTVGLLT